MAQVVARVVRRNDAPEHVMQVARNRTLIDRMHDLTVFNPMARDTAGIIAGGRVDRRPKKARYDQAGAHLGNQVIA